MLTKDRSRSSGSGSPATPYNGILFGVQGTWVCPLELARQAQLIAAIRPMDGNQNARKALMWGTVGKPKADPEKKLLRREVLFNLDHGDFFSRK